MTSLDIDAIYQALFDRLSTDLAGVAKYFTRREDHFESAISQPALLVTASNIVPNREKGLPTTWRLGAKVFMYVKSVDGSASPETQLLELVGLIEASLVRSRSEPGTTDPDDYGTTLGGLVSSVSMTGVELDGGIDTGQGVAVVDLVMVAHT